MDSPMRYGGVDWASRSHAVCVVDREEGGADALARVGVRLAALYRAGDLLPEREQGMNPHG